jgi:hypothetical protein
MNIAPQLSVSLGTPVNPAAGWTMDFNVVNTGKLDLGDVTVDCLLEAVKTEKYSVGGIAVRNGPPLVGRTLSPGERGTTYCAFLETFKNPGRTEYARIALRSEFMLKVIPWKLKRVFKFELREIPGLPPTWEQIPSGR